MAAIFIFRPNGKSPGFQIVAQDWEEAAKRMEFCLQKDGHYDSVRTISDNGVVKILTKREGKETLWVPNIERDESE